MKIYFFNMPIAPMKIGIFGSSGACAGGNSDKKI